MQSEVVDHDEGRIGGEAYRVRHLVDHPQAKVLEHRQDLRQDDRSAPQEYLEAHVRIGGPERTVKRHPQRARPQRLFDQADVGDGLLRIKAFPVAGRKCALVALEQELALLLAVGGEERVMKVIGPAPGRIDDCRFELVDVVIRDFAGRGAYDELQPRHRRVADLAVVRRDFTGEGLGQDRLDGKAPRGRVAVERQIHHAGDEPLEVVAAQEQTHPPALLKIENAERGRQQMVFGNLEQLVAGVGLDNVHQRPAVVLSRIESGAGDNVVQLAL